MKVELHYFCRNGEKNSICFDTETKTYKDFFDGYGKYFAFVEARRSGDIDKLRNSLIADGYIKEE